MSILYRKMYPKELKEFRKAYEQADKKGDVEFTFGDEVFDTKFVYYWFQYQEMNNKI